MNQFLDERFPNLESLATFLNTNGSYEPPLDSIIQKMEAQRKARSESLRDSMVKHKQAMIHDALAKGVPLSSSEFSEETQDKVIEILELQQDRSLLKRAIEIASYLNNDPSTHAHVLKETLEELKDNSNPLAMEIKTAIRTQWYDSELLNCLANLESILKKAGWPKSDPPANSPEVTQAIKKSTDLELPQSLSTMEVLAKPIAERIAFHFSKGRDTARDDKPEWLFAYVTKLMDPRVRWVNNELRKFMDAPVDKLLIALCPTVVSVCRSCYSIDTHFVSELIKFLSDLERKYWCSSETTDMILFGILDPIVLHKYLTSEKENYNDLFDTLIKSGSQSIDFDVDVPCAKPTFITENLCQTIHQANYLVRLSPSFVLNSIHLHLTKKYLEWLENQLDMYDRSHSSLARAVGTNKEVLPKNTHDLEYLARLFGSSSYLKRFLDIWSTDIQTSVVKKDIDQLAESYAELRSKLANRLASVLTRETQKHLKSYIGSDWQLSDADEKREAGSLIRSAITAIMPSISFLNRLYPRSESDRARTMVPWADSIAKVFWRLVIQANIFTESGAEQLRVDIEYFWLAFNLPITESFRRNIDATSILQGNSVKEDSPLTEDQVDGLKRRRSNKNNNNL